MKMKYFLVSLILLFFKHAETKIFNAEEFVLDNGLKVVLVENKRAPIVSHMIWYNVGSVDEDYGKSGLAHFLEHLMFKGTSKYPGGFFSSYISRNGGSENAFTSYDYTAYYQIIPADKIEKIIELEADRMRNLVLTKEQVKTEKKVILEERNQRIDSDPSSILDESMRKSLFPNHTYGTPIIGWKHEIMKLGYDDIFDFYKKYYVPSNATVILSGDIDLSDAKKFTKKYYGRIKTKNQSIKRLNLLDPEIKTTIRINHNNENVNQKIWKRIYKVPSYRNSVKEGIALDIGLNILAGGTTSILYDQLVKKKKLVSAVGGYYQGMTREKGTIYFYAIPNKGIEIEKLEKILEEDILDAINNKITNKEFVKQKKIYKNEAIYLRDSIFQPAQIIGEALTIGLKLEDIENWNLYIDDLTINEVIHELKRILVNKNFVTGILG